MASKMRNKRMRCRHCGRTTEHVPLGRPVGGGARPRAAGVVLISLLISLGVVWILFRLSDTHLREFFALMPVLTRDVISGGVAGGVAVGGTVLLAGARRVQIALYGQFYDWRCSLCGLVRTPRR